MDSFPALLQGTGCILQDVLPLQGTGISKAVQAEPKDGFFFSPSSYEEM